MQQPANEPTADVHHDPYAAFRHRPFWIYLSSYVLAVISSAMLSFAAKYEVNALTRHLGEETASLYLGILGGVGAIPIIGLSLFAGHVVDRFNRKRVLIVTQVILSICPAVFAVLAMRGVHNVWVVYLLLLINGVALTFARPARSSLISVLVPRKDFSNAVTWNSTFFETAAAIGPAFAGFMIADIGLATSLFVSAACMATCLAISFALPNPGLLSGATERPGWHSLMAGFRFVLRTRLLFATMALDLFAVLFGGATYLLPVFADRLGVGAQGLGWMIAAPGAGAITMALLQAHLPPFRRAGLAMLVAVVGFGLATIVFGMSKSYPLSLAMLYLMGAFDNVSVIVRHSLVQILTPDSMRGRVSAVNQIFIGSSNELGGLESGLTARAFGSPMASVVFGGVAVIAVVGVVTAKYPEVRRLGRLRDVAAREDDADPAQSTPPLQSTT